MYTMPAAMIQNLRNPPFQLRCWCQVYQRPFPLPTTYTAPNAWLGSQLIGTLPIESGSITIDNSGAQRRRGSIVVPATNDILPVSVSSTITPFRNLVLIYYSVGAVGTVMPVFPPLAQADANASSILLGIFTLTDVAVAAPSSGDRTMTLDLQDISQDVSRRVLTNTYVTPNGTPITAAIEQLLQYAAPGVIPWFTSDVSTALTSGSDSAPDLPNAAGYTWDPGQDPWEAGQEMAQAIGMEMFFTPTGVCQLSYIANPAKQIPVWGYSQSSITGDNPFPPANITSITRTFSQSQVYNLVQMIVESANSNPSPDLLYTGTSFLAQVWDTDPTSPTYAGGGTPATAGPYGIAADVYYDQFNYQSGPALVAAKALLRQGLGAADVVEFTAIPNPAHEAYDVINVFSTRIGLNGTINYVIDTCELPLTPGKDMTITARRVVNV